MGLLPLSSKISQVDPILGLPAPPRALAAPPAPRVMAARVGKSASILSSARTPRLHVAARRHSAQVLCSKPSPSFHGLSTPCVQRGRTPRTGRGRPAADSIVEHAADAANLGGGGRARARAGRSGCVIVGWRGGANCARQSAASWASVRALVDCRACAATACVSCSKGAAV